MSWDLQLLGAYLQLGKWKVDLPGAGLHPTIKEVEILEEGLHFCSEDVELRRDAPQVVEIKVIFWWAKGHFMGEKLILSTKKVKKQGRLFLQPWAHFLYNFIN